MEKSERDAQKLPMTFFKPVYKDMYSFCHNKTVNANRTMDSSRPNDESSATTQDEENNGVQDVADVLFELIK